MTTSPGVKVQPIVHTLADLAVQIEQARLLNYRAAWMVDAGLLLNAEASMTRSSPPSCRRGLPR